MNTVLLESVFTWAPSPSGTLCSDMREEDRMRYPNYRAPQGRGFWSDITLDSGHLLWRLRAVLRMFLSLQPSCCDGPKPCFSSEGLWQDTVAGQQAWPCPLLWEGGFTEAHGTETKAARALCPVVGGPGLLSSSFMVAEGHGLFSLWRKQWRGKL